MSLEPLVVLIVDDEPGILTLLRNLVQFQFQGTNDVVVEAVDSGSKAIEVLRARTVPVVVLDIMMPDVSGFAVLRAIRDDGIPCRVLVLSAKHDQATQRLCLALGAEMFMSKPFDPIELGRLIARWVEAAFTEGVR